MRYAANLAVTIILARLLAPADFGLAAMAAAFTGLLLLFKDGGLETTLMSHGAMSDQERAAVAGFTLGYGLLLAVACALLGPLLAQLFGEPRLRGALLLPAAAFVFHGLDVLPGVELLRTHRFRTHAAIETAATILGWGCSLLLAWRGAGYWALFVAEPVTAIALLAGHSAAAAWRPRFNFAWGTIRPLIRFSHGVNLTRALGHASRNVDNLILGVTAGAAGLAYYNKAFRLIGMPQEAINGPLTRIAIPSLTRCRDHPEGFVQCFRHFTFVSIALGLPGVGLLLVSTPGIVSVVYGPQWEPAVPLIRWLGLMGAGHTFLFCTGWVFASTRNIERQVRWDGLNLLLLAAAFTVGAHWGLTGVAVAASLGYASLRLPALVYCFRDTPLRLRDVGGVLWRPLLATLVGSGLVWVARLVWAAPAAPVLSVVRDAVILGAGYLLGWVIVPGWRAALRRELQRPDPPAGARTPASD